MKTKNLFIISAVILGAFFSVRAQIPAGAVKFSEAARSSEANKEYDGVLESYNQALQIYSKYPAALAARGWLYARAKE